MSDLSRPGKITMKAVLGAAALAVASLSVWAFAGMESPPPSSRQANGQCFAGCAAEQGMCMGQCGGNGQCINNCAAAYGRCVARCQ